MLLALELLTHELNASDEDICQRVRTDVAVMYACGLPEVHADPSQAHFVLPDTLAQCRGRIDQDVMDTLVAIQAAAAMEAGLVSPAHVLVDTFPAEQGSHRVTDATTLYKAQKNSSTSSNASARRACSPAHACSSPRRSSSSSYTKSCGALAVNVGARAKSLWHWCGTPKNSCSSWAGAWAPGHLGTRGSRPLDRKSVV